MLLTLEFCEARAREAADDARNATLKMCGNDPCAPKLHGVQWPISFSELNANREAIRQERASRHLPE